MGSTRHLPRNFRLGVAPAVLGVVGLGVIGGLYAGAPSENAPTPQRIPVSAVATTTDTGDAPMADQRSAPAAPFVPEQLSTENPEFSADEQQLMGNLPPGYGPNSCNVVSTRPANSIATVDCGQNSGPGGPALARYSLYPDIGLMEATFTNRTLNEITVGPCPNGSASPGTWHYGTQGEPMGSIVCGTDRANSNSPAVGWTDNKTLVLAVAEGPDLDALYAWWEHPGTPTPNAIRGSA